MKIFLHLTSQSEFFYRNWIFQRLLSHQADDQRVSLEIFTMIASVSLRFQFPLFVGFSLRSFLLLQSFLFCRKLQSAHHWSCHRFRRVHRKMRPVRLEASVNPKNWSRFDFVDAKQTEKIRDLLCQPCRWRRQFDSAVPGGHSFWGAFCIWLGGQCQGTSKQFLRATVF